MDKEIHSVRPFDHAHIDHTQLDVILLSGESKDMLNRPWLSFATDAESRAILATKAARSQEVSRG